MTSITTTIPDELNHALSFVAKSMDESRDDIIYKAIKAYVQELQEDIEDAEEALAAMNDKDMKCYTSEEMKERLETRYRMEHGL